MFFTFLNFLIQRHKPLFFGCFAWSLLTAPMLFAGDIDPTPDGGSGAYLVGAGIYDITGPAAEIGMMGFADLHQHTNGIFTRLRARAMIFGDEKQRVVVVTADLGMLFQAVKLGVVQKIKADPELSRYYDEKNVLLAATHTHSGPGGFSGYLLYDASVGGFVWQNFNAIVDGIFQAIARAHRNLEPGQLLYTEGELENCGWNRSVKGYDNNPASERAAYNGNTDRSFVLLKLVSARGEELGMINWFAVHPDSIGPQNGLISADNKGLAAYWFERDHHTDYRANKTFVAAFAQANAGDVTPNVPYGPAPAAVDLPHNPSLKNAATRQYNKAKELYEQATEPLVGPIAARHEWVSMPDLFVAATGHRACPAAMGASFSYGSPFDNPSPAPLFPEGMTVAKLAAGGQSHYRTISWFLKAGFGLLWSATDDPAFQACQAEKPIMIPTGLSHLNLNNIPMTPEIVPLQLLRVGTLAIVAVPAEVTTMAGRRLKATALAALAPAGVKHVVISSLANTYVSYLATREEYAVQTYEGASTQFGPDELAGFQQEFAKLGQSMVRGRPVASGPVPRDVTPYVKNFIPGVVFDDKPLGRHFGDIMTGAHPRYQRGDTVNVSFWGGHPRNNLMTQDSYLTVERKIDETHFIVVAHDWDPSTTFRWQRQSIAYNKITITWDSTDAEPGEYRIRHRGYYKQVFTGAIKPYEGVTPWFAVD